MNNQASDVIIVFDVNGIIHRILEYTCYYVFERNLTQSEKRIFLSQIYKWVKLELEKEIESNHAIMFQDKSILKKDINLRDIILQYGIPEVLGHLRDEQTNEYIALYEDTLNYITNLNGYKELISRVMQGPTLLHWVLYERSDIIGKLFLKNVGSFNYSFNNSITSIHLKW